MKKSWFPQVVLAGLAWAWFFAAPLSAQSLITSRHADFSTQDVSFTFSDTLFAKVTASQIDFTDLKKNEYRLKPADTEDDDSDAEGEFTNNLDGTYAASIPLSELDHEQNAWEFRVELKDGNDNEFKTRIALTITDSTDNEIVELEGRISALGENYLEISSNRIFVDDETEVMEFGAPLVFDSLKIDWLVHVFAEQHESDSLLAQTIDVLERSQSGIEVETRGVISHLTDSTMTVNGILFLIDASTELRDKDGNLIAISAFQAGMEVEARGVTNALGDVIATQIEIKDDNSGGREIEFTGRITEIFSGAPLPDSILVDGQLLEIDAQTVLLGFENEPILVSDLRVGENLEVRALTRSNAIPLALRLKREDSGETEVRVVGEIESLGDSMLTVTGLAFQIQPTTIILDDENLFIDFAQLFTGLNVEVEGNRLADSSLAATKVKIEDDVADVVEFSGFLEAKSDSSLTVSGQLLLALNTTKFLDQDGALTTFESLQIGAQLAVSGERRFNGGLIAREVRILDFLGDDIIFRGEIEATNEEIIRVADLDFRLDAMTEIRDAEGNPISSGDLKTKSVVELRASKSGEMWLALKITQKTTLDATILLTAEIDSLAGNEIILAGKRFRLTDRTRILDQSFNAIPAGDLAPGQTVATLAKPLADGSMLASQIIQNNATPGFFSLNGAIDTLGGAQLTIVGFSIAFDASTPLLDRFGQAIAIDSLYPGAIINAEGTRMPGGALQAEQLQLSPRRLLTGQTNAITQSSLEIRGVSHAVDGASLAFDEQNRPISIGDIEPKQQIRLTGTFADGQWRTLNVRLLFRDQTTDVTSSELPATPKSFSLEQSYPNPFDLRTNGLATIRFKLTKPAKTSLTVFNLLGQRIITLIEASLPAGEARARWDGRDASGRVVAQGAYFYRLQIGNSILTKKLLVLR